MKMTPEEIRQLPDEEFERRLDEEFDELIHESDEALAAAYEAKGRFEATMEMQEKAIAEWEARELEIRRRQQSALEEQNKSWWGRMKKIPVVYWDIIVAAGILSILVLGILIPYVLFGLR